MNLASTRRTTPAPTPWLKRFGLAGLLFFTIKGILWLVIPAALAALI